LLPQLDSLLAEAGWHLSSADLIAVGIGPGSFTGLRVGLATAKGLALSTRLPLVGVSSLEAAAQAGCPCQIHLCPVYDARKKEVYAGLYQPADGGVSEVSPPAVLPLTELCGQISSPTLFLGDGAGRFREALSASLGDLACFPEAREPAPRATALAVLGVRKFAREGADSAVMLVPQYVRRPDAEVNYLRRHREGGGE
jgi:tRNA threonylcarbamoyladenosine biosynthesis protein TsaB